jgi:hypothetical protein
MHDRLSWTQSAIARILRPAVRLALAMGLKHVQLEDVLRKLLLEEARHLWNTKGVEQPNLSQLSMTTGLNRKEVTARMRETRDTLPHTEGSAITKAYTAWLQLATDDPRHRRLPISDSGDGPSFELIARLAARGDVHHRAVLDELVRLGMVAVQNESVELRGDSFIPVDSLRDMLAFLGDNARDHLLAAVGNTIGAGPRMLERAVFATGIPLEECERIHQLARKHWDAVHYKLVKEMTHAYQHADGAGTARIRVGVYTYYEDESGRESLATTPSFEHDGLVIHQERK